MHACKNYLMLLLSCIDFGIIAKSIIKWNMFPFSFVCNTISANDQSGHHEGHYNWNISKWCMCCNKLTSRSEISIFRLHMKGSFFPSRSKSKGAMECEWRTEAIRKRPAHSSLQLAPSSSQKCLIMLKDQHSMLSLSILNIFGVSNIIIPHICFLSKRNLFRLCSHKVLIDTIQNINLRTNTRAN